MKRGVLIAILVIVIIVVILFLMGGFIYLQFTQEPYIPNNAYLKINLKGEIVDCEQGVFSKTLTVKDLWYHLARAKKDFRIKGILLKINPLHTGYAKVADIGAMIKDFRSSGKKVYAYLEGGGLKEYLLATHADKVYLFAGGELFLNGLSAQAMFLKKSLSKLGIKGEFYHIGNYKTAADMFTEEEMTPYHQESLQKLLDDIYNSTLDTIAQNRKLDQNVLKQMIENEPPTNQEFKKAGLVDDVLYEDEILSDSKDKYQWVKFKTYKETTAPLPFSGGSVITVIFTSGEIHMGESGSQSITGNRVMGSDTVVKQLRYARKNPLVKAVVLRVDSPGGSPFASDAIRREAEITMKEKPVIISMSDLAASGGYMISMSSSKIFALPQTLTGSIGVVGGKFVLKDLYEKIGVKKVTLKTSPHADMFSDYREFSQKEQKIYVSIMKRIYDFFVEKVSIGRKMSPEKIEEVAQGRVWTGKTALTHGLVDQMGGLNAAINEAAKLAKLPEKDGFRVRIYPRDKTVWDLISDLVGANAEKLNSNITTTIQEKIRMAQDFFPALILPYQVQIR